MNGRRYNRMEPLSKPDPLLDVRHLSVHYHVQPRGVIRAVDDVSFCVHRGETLALVGESGCGKSTVGRALLGLVPCAAGSAQFLERDLCKLRPVDWKPARRELSMIFQDPSASLDPRWRIGISVAEPLRIHGLCSRADALDRAAAMLEKVGIERNLFHRYPHELSGGQRQRVAIARALATHPKLVIADEPTAALDISIRAQILNLICDLREDLGASFLFVSHDLSTVQYLADRVAVMYLGKIVEVASKERMAANPMHPYTRALLTSVPSLTETGRLPPTLAGEIPDALNMPSGCRFRTRCPLAAEVCAGDVPELREVEPGHFVACVFA